MSLKQITLRPPPNVDFVHGKQPTSYPGIPPGNNRPPAEVMGSVELRFPKDGLKTKWVKVALRKIETLPGAIPASPTPDFIGQMPQTIWAAQGEEELIVNKELQFRLHLPESIPPSITLDKGSGIRYELVASVCVKGKRGLLRKSASTVIEDIQILQIDKHELHSTWPVYNQPDTRSESRDQLTLTATRTKSCFSPGERVSVQATLNSNSFTAAHLRAFDFSLVETIHFRPGPKIKPSKKAGPLFKSTRIGEHRIPVNATLYGGMKHSADLSCVVSPEHIHPTVNSARNIDVAYKIVVIAQVDNVKPYSLELPVSISNWQRMASIDLTNKIGQVPNLSLDSPTAVPKHTQRLNRGDRTLRYDHLQQPPLQQPSQSPQPVATHVTAANATITTSPRPTDTKSNEFGQSSTETKASTLPAKQTIRDDSALPPRPREKEKVRPSTATNTASDTTSSATAQPSRLTVANQHPNEEGGPSWISATEEKLRLRQRDVQQSTATPTPNSAAAPIQARTQWPSAEEEKRRMFEQAQKRATMAQNEVNFAAATSQQPAVSSAPPSGSKPKASQWPSAENEKRRLFEEAKRRVEKSQVGAVAESRGEGGSQSTAPARSQSFGSPGRVPSPAPPITGASLYSNAMAAVQAKQNAPPNTTELAQTPPPIHTPPPPATRTSHSRTPSQNGPSRAYPTAEEEKAAMRYAEAKRAVEQGYANPAATVSSSSRMGTHDSMMSAPIPYDQLFPDQPEVNGTPARDSYRQGSTTSSPDARLSRIPSHDLQPAPPPPASSLPRRRPSLPSPPMVHSSSKPLSAAEEKARLRAQYEAEEAEAESAANGTEPNSRASGSHSRRTTQSFTSEPRHSFLERAPRPNDPTPLSRDPTIKQGKQRATHSNTPPPLLPKPPPDYIEETQAEDERLRTQLDDNTPAPLIHEEPRAQSPFQSPFEFSLSMRPFSPFDAGLSNVGHQDMFASMGSSHDYSENPAPVPPLPPKIPISH